MEFKNVTCFGSGLIGSSFATGFVMNGIDTVIYDIDQDKLDKALELVKQNLKFLYDNGMLDDAKFQSSLNRLTMTTDIKEAVKDADFIQENGPENYDIKRSIIASIEEHCKPDCIIASSTSGLLISEIAKNAKYPERIIGGHPYNPPHLIPLVEISKGDKTSQENIDKAVRFYKEIKKEPVVLQKEALGFIANRLQVAVNREATELVMRGVCTVEEVDKALVFGPGLRYGLLGPNLNGELGGGAHGLTGILTHIGPSVELWYQDMATWTKYPEGAIEILQKGVNEEKANRPANQGRTNDEIKDFRDKGLLMLLKYHDKL